MENTPQIYREYESALEYTDLKEKKKWRENKISGTGRWTLIQEWIISLAEGLATVPWV